MEIIGIKHISPLYDSSGYSQAARSYVMALHKLGIPLTLEPITFEVSKPELTKDEERVFSELLYKKIDYNIVFLQLMPEHWPKLRELDKVNVGCTVWETTKLHKDWVEILNTCTSLVICPSKWNRDVFVDSGVTKPVSIVPYILDLEDFETIPKFEVSGIKKDAYKFYSVFQFTERKNPMALLKSYWATFQNGENVALILKTYKNDFSESQKKDVIGMVRRIKEIIKLKNYAPVFLVLDMMTREQVLGLNVFGDCYVSLDRGEGFGLGGFEAAASGNPVIVPGFGGVLEYAKPEFSYHINYTFTPVFGMPWVKHYQADQMWLDPDCHHAMQTMMHVYQNQEEAKEKGQQLRKFIGTNFTSDLVAASLVKEIEKL
jgi:glycosyltransferase involved in cell wall biosynthesis